LKTRKTER